MPYKADLISALYPLNEKITTHPDGCVLADLLAYNATKSSGCQYWIQNEEAIMPWLCVKYKP